MNLLLIITDYGSYNNFLVELAYEFVKNPDNEIHIACSQDKIINIQDKIILKGPNVNFHFIDIPRSITFTGQIKAARTIRKLVKLVRPDLIHSHFTTATLPTVLLRKSGFTYWSTLHGLGMNSSTGFKRIIFTFVEFFCFMRLNKLFVINNEDYTLVKNLFDEKVIKYKSLGVGCDINKFDRNLFSVDQIKSLKEALLIPEETVVLTFTGRYVHFKGFHIVIAAFKRLCSMAPGKYKLILMGGYDPIHKTGLNKEEERFFEDCDDIINLGFTNKVNEYLSVTDMFVFPSKKEGLPTCVLEALSMGVPVITFNSRGNNDIIKNDYNGILIEPQKSVVKESDDIVLAIEKLAGNKDRYDMLRRNALKDRPDYSRDRFIDENLAYYSAL